MKASLVYKKLINPDLNYVGPNSSKVTLLAESDHSRLGVFALQFSSMINYPVKSYGKIKHSYQIEIWSYNAAGELDVEETFYFSTKAQMMSRFEKGGF